MRSDVGTAVTRSPVRTRAANSSSINSAVEPLPSPMMTFSGTSATAARAAARFHSVCASPTPPVTAAMSASQLSYAHTDTLH